MIPLFTYPLALLGLLALPTLAAIYLLRNRFRRQPVSSLLLWRFTVQSREGGTQIQRLQLPWIFLLELLALLLLTVAAAGPRWQLPATTRPLVVVLDDSHSMLAREGSPTPRDQARRALASLLQERRFSSIRLIAAGLKPRLLGPPAHRPGDLADRWPLWTCQAPHAQLDAALQLAVEIGTAEAELLVLTDQAPPSPEPLGPRLQWWAFGRPLPNLALVSAARTPHELQDRCFLEIANFSAAPREATWTLRAGQTVLRQETRTLPAAERYRASLHLPPNLPEISLSLTDDALPGDNQAWLLPAPRPRVRVRVPVASPELRQELERTLDATGLRAPAHTQADLVIHETAAPPAEPEAWTLRLFTAANAQAYTGPFVSDPRHPWLQGLALDGVIWSAAPVVAPDAGTPLLLAGNVPLLLAREDALGRQRLMLNLAPETSNLAATPNWPILFWNLLAWRARELPGAREPNLRLGAEARVKLPGENVQIIFPDGSARHVTAPSRELVFEAEQPGRYQVVAGEARYPVAANFLAPEESDLSGSRSGRWGAWNHEADVRFEYASVFWLFLLAGLAALVAHLFALTRRKGGTHV